MEVFGVRNSQGVWCQNHQFKFLKFKSIFEFEKKSKINQTQKIDLNFFKNLN